MTNATKIQRLVDRFRGLCAEHGEGCAIPSCQKIGYKLDRRCPCGNPFAHEVCSKTERREPVYEPSRSSWRMVRMCDLKGCQRPHKARGLCALHYRRKQREEKARRG